MRTKRRFTAFLTVASFLCAGISAFGLHKSTDFVSAAAENTGDFSCNVTVAPKDDAYSYYSAQSCTLYTASEAAAAGVPAGYDGDVIQVISKSSSCGVLVDFSEMEIPFNLVQALEFRVYLGVNSENTGKYPQIRIPRPYALGSEWVYQENSCTPSGEWTTVSVPSTKPKFNSLQNEDGNLGKFELALRTQAKIDFYIDDISCVLLENDGVAPEISGVEEEIFSSEGAQFIINPIAFDVQENREVEVTQTWSEGALDDDGKLVQGGHTLTLTATDFWGNQSQKQVKVIVLEPDTEAPIIGVPDAIYTEVGAIFLYDYSVSDNRELVRVTPTWSSGALDENGGLKAGVHTLTIVAVDSSDNKTEKVITFYVTEDGNGPGEIIDEEELTKPGSDSSVDSETSSDSTVESESENIFSSESDTENEESNENTSSVVESDEEESSKDVETDSESEEEDVPSDTESDEESTDNVVSEPQAQKGCFGSISGVSIGLFGLITATFILKKKENE